MEKCIDRDGYEIKVGDIMTVVMSAVELVNEGLMKYDAVNISHKNVEIIGIEEYKCGKLIPIIAGGLEVDPKWLRKISDVDVETSGCELYVLKNRSTGRYLSIEVECFLVDNLSDAKIFKEEKSAEQWLDFLHGKDMSVVKIKVSEVL